MNFFIVLAITLLAVVSVYLVIVFNKRRRCPKCGKWFAGKYVNRVSYNLGLVKPDSVNYKKLKSILKPAMKYETHIYRKCRYCNYQYKYTVRSLRA